MTHSTRLYFSIGDYGPGGYEIELLPSGELCLKRGIGPGLFGEPRLIQVPPERWQTFWNKLDTIDVWNWKTSYDSTVLDGTQWQLDLAHAGRTLQTSGNNVYPESDTRESVLDYPRGGQFARLLTALRTLASAE